MSQTAKDDLLRVVYTSLIDICAQDHSSATYDSGSDLTDLSASEDEECRGEEVEDGEILEPNSPESDNEPPRKKPRGPRSAAKMASRLERSILRLIEKMVLKAKENKVVFDSISLKDVLANGLPEEDASSNEWTSWTWDPASGQPPTPRLGVDKNGVAIVLWLPQFLTDAAHERLLNTTVHFGEAVEKALSKGSGADSCGRNVRDAYREVPGELAGCINIAIWHAVGHEHKEPVLSRDQLGTSSRLSSCEQLISDLSLATSRLNKILELLDPPAFRSHQDLRNEMARYPIAKSRMHIDPSLWQGRSVIFNRQTPDHVDRRDDPKEFTPIFVLGHFGGGYIRLKTLRLRMWFGGGACVFIRGGLFPHGIEPFHGSQRVSIAHFAHRSLFRQLDVKLSSLGLN